MKKLFLLFFTTLCSLISCIASESLSSSESVSVNPITGQLRYELPLYTINDPDFNWPISLTYTSDGFHPFDYSYPVGSGWDLIADGVISREIIGVSDDLDTVTGYFPYSYDIGFLTYVRNPNVPNFQNGNYRDDGSDIYSYSFGPYSGSFVFDSVGNPQVVNGDFVYIDASGVYLQKNWSAHGAQNWLSSNNLQSSCFVLTTLDGYKYYFGSSTPNPYVEYGGSLGVGNSMAITTWHLQRIEAPNGSKLIFYYRNIAQPLWRYDRSYDTWYHNTDDINEIVSDTLSMQLLKQYAHYHTGAGSPLLYSYTLLDSIKNTTTGLKVDFSYSWNDNKVFSQSTAPGVSLCVDSLKPFLSSLQINVGNETLKTWAFTYQNVNKGFSSRRFLSSATDGCDNTHTFSYDTTSLPDLQDEVPSSLYDVYGYYITDPKFGTLISSTNPLGAMKYYSYSNALVDSVRLPSFEQGQWIAKTIFYDRPLCHTIKVSEISVTDGDSTFYRKRYNYGEIELDTQQAPAIPGSGLIKYSNGVVQMENACYHSSSPTFYIYPFQQLHASNPPIIYKNVRETILDASNTLLRKTIYKSQTDSFIYRGTGGVKYYSFGEFHKALPYFQSDLWFRQLCSYKEYNASDQLINEKTNEYTGSTANDKIIYNKRNCWINIPSSKYHCTKRIETSHDVTTTASFTFDSKFRLRKQTQTKGIDTLFTRYVYPDDISLSQHSGLPSGTDSCFWGTLFLASKNLIGTPIETYGGYIKNGIEYTTSGVLELHKVDWTQLPHGQILANFTKETRTLHLSSSIASYSPVYAANFALIYNANYDMVSVSHYTFWNRLNWEQNVSSALRTYYQWSSDKMYPISKTIGGRTWQYTYSPYLGITSETDPRDIITGYQYDACGRLIEKYLWRNNQKNILEHYIYH